MACCTCYTLSYFNATCYDLNEGTKPSIRPLGSEGRQTNVPKEQEISSGIVGRRTASDPRVRRASN